MAHIKADRVQETTASNQTGNGALIVNGATTKMRPFGAVMASGDTCVCLIENASAAEWEVSLCTYSSGSNALTRSTVYASSTGGLVFFSAGVKTISLVPESSKQVTMDPGGDATIERHLDVRGNLNVRTATAGVGSAIMVAGSATQAGFFGVINSAGTRLGFVGYNNTDMAIIADSPAKIVLNAAAGIQMLDVTGVGMAPLMGASAYQFVNGDLCLYGSNRSVMGGLYYQSGGWKYSHSGTGAALIMGQSSSIPFMIMVGRNNVAGPGASADLSMVSAYFIPEGAAAHWLPWGDNVQNLGDGSHRMGTIFAGTGTINTSDARDKSNARALSTAEIRVGRRLARLVQIWQFNDAVAVKGDQARWHTGWVAQTVMEAFTAEGADPFRHACVGFDLLTKSESYEEFVSRPRLRDVEATEEVVEIVDGVPRLVARSVTRKEPVGEIRPVLDVNGDPVMVATGQKDGDGRDIRSPLMHFVPAMEEVPESRVRVVPDMDEGGEQKQRLNVRPDQLLAFVVAALDAGVSALEERVTNLESA
jgi:hypothetical protein